MKKLHTNNISIVTCWQNLKSIGPREFSTIDEMEKAMAVVEVLKGAVPDFVRLLGDESAKLTASRSTMSTQDYGKAIDDLNAKLTRLETEHGKDNVEANFEDADFNAFFQFFEKWGKNWFNTVSDFLDFRKEMNSTNQQPKNAQK